MSKKMSKMITIGLCGAALLTGAHAAETGTPPPLPTFAATLEKLSFSTYVPWKDDETIYIDVDVEDANCPDIPGAGGKMIARWLAPKKNGTGNECQPCEKGNMCPDGVKMDPCKDDDKYQPEDGQRACTGIPTGHKKVNNYTADPKTFTFKMRYTGADGKPQTSSITCTYGKEPEKCFLDRPAVNSNVKIKEYRLSRGS